jgi:hypothetical protein
MFPERIICLSGESADICDLAQLQRSRANLDQRATRAIDDSTDFGASIIQADGERLVA